MFAASDLQQSVLGDIKMLTLDLLCLFRSLRASCGAHGPGERAVTYCIPVVSPTRLFRLNSCRLGQSRL